MGLKNTTTCYGYTQVNAAGTAVAFSIGRQGPTALSPTAPTYAIIQAEAQALPG